MWNISHFHLLPGLTTSNEIRDGPAYFYLRPVSSEPTCKKVNPPQSPQSTPSPPPCHPDSLKPRHGSEKVANFKAPNLKQPLQTREAMWYHHSRQSLCSEKSPPQQSKQWVLVEVYQLFYLSISNTKVRHRNEHKLTKTQPSLSQGQSKLPSRHSSYSPP